MSKNKQVYDQDSKTVRVYRVFEKEKTLVPPEETQKFIGVLRDRKTDKGQPVERVQYVFESEATAEYNHQALAFAGIETYLGDETNSRPYGDAPSFSVREDFGID